jgi:energy-coupling factor transport system permease protein
MTLHLDPRTKLILTVLYGLLVIASGQLPWLLAELALLVFAILAVGEGCQYLSWLRLVVVMTAVWFVISLLAFDLSVAVGASLRLLALTSAFFLFFRTTTPEDLGNALVQAGLPYVFAFVLSASLQFVPVISRKAQHIFDAQRSRGIPLEPGLAALRHYPALMAPLLIQAFQLADELAEAMESRGFGSSHRTFAVEYRLQGRDYGLLLLAAAGLIVLGYWSRQLA